MKNLLEIRGLSKHYPGVHALKGVSFDIRRNSVHCIVGENGAGKSTLIKILTGAIQRSAGEIIFKGKEYHPKSTNDAIEAGISFIYQELNVIEQFTVEENLNLGMEKSWGGVIRKDRSSISKYEDILKKLEPSISLTQKVLKLSVAYRQIIEIARALAVNAELIIMDEPTASLSDEEVNRLFSIIRRLKEENVTIVYISHRLEEIFRIGDRVTVLRDGEMIATKDLSEIGGKSELIQLMLGKVVTTRYIPNRVDESVKVLDVRSLSTDRLDSISFDLRKGEILGFYGLIGSGKTEIARAIYGVDRIRRGRIVIDGIELKPKIPRRAIRKGLVMVPEERRQEGIFGILPIKDNIPIMNAKKIARFGFTSAKKERTITVEYIRKLSIAAKGIAQEVATLSGGNQQKVVIGKCLNADPRILIMDEPTRGIDVGAKEEIHAIIRDLARRGNSIIVLSSELPEIVNLCDRIVLLLEGRIKKILKNGETLDTEEIMRVVTGLGEDGK
jgi:ribose transport system ATP-binding protein